MRPAAPAITVVLIASLGLGAGPLAVATERIYHVRYDVRLDPAREGAHVSMKLVQPRDFARSFRFHIRNERQTTFEGDGELQREGQYVRWLPPERGGQLSWFARLTSRRGGDAYDGIINPRYALFRGDDLVPPATVRSLKGARALARLHFELPAGWSVITPYPQRRNGVFDVDHVERRFDRPTGWMAAGELGVRWSTVSGTRVAVAAPVGHGFRRMDTLAFLRWTLPSLKRIFPDFERRLLVVGAGDPMWRGGLSGPGSVFVHAERPLISENATSTLLHELVHNALGASAEQGADWIVEGLAEYYSLEILKRSGAISPSRQRRALENLAQWGRGVSDLFLEHSTGRVTARAAGVFAALDREIDDRTGGREGLDDVVRELISAEKISFPALRAVATSIAGGPVEALAAKHVPGAPGTR